MMRETIVRVLDRAAATWKARVTTRRDYVRRIRAADSFLFLAMQAAIAEYPELRLKLIHEARAALRGEYPQWWTEANHVQLDNLSKD